MTKDKRWKPEDTYYFIDSIGMVGSHKWCDDSADKAYYAIGNCFKTEDAAKAASEKVQSLLLGLHESSTECSQAVTECNQLPKLTTDVFDREDCPEWARYAVVNSKGVLIFFGGKPTFEGADYGCWSCSCCPYKHIRGIVFDASDWQNSLIERPATLPDWCKVDAIGWHKRCGYFKVTYIDNVSKRVDIRQVEDNSKGYLSFHTVCNEVRHARPRPYNEYEMEALVGKVLKHSTGSYLVEAFEHRWSQVKIEGVWRDANELAELWSQRDGHPCFVLEHLNEKGEWTE